MPSVSKAQHGAMEAAAHGGSTLGIPAKVGKEYAEADTKKPPPKKRYSESDTRATANALRKPRVMPGMQGMEGSGAE
jgi:hypothetical protein